MTNLMVERPAEVIDLRRELVHFWEQDTPLTRAVSMHGRVSASGRDDPFAMRLQSSRSRAWMYDTLRVAELYWVSPEMVDVMAATAPTVPDVTPHPPTSAALLLFAKPYIGQDAVTGKTLEVAGYLWGRVIIEDIPCVEIESFGWRDRMHPTNAADPEQERFAIEFVRSMPVRLMMSGGSEWPLDHLTSSEWEVGPRLSASAQASIIEDRRVLSTFWALVQQRLTIERSDPGDRHVQRRAQRAGLQLSPVRVITLRQATRPHEAEGIMVDWSHRWIVGGHWRQQPYGPRRERRRVQWIAPFMKGPADKPLVVRETVRALKR